MQTCSFVTCLHFQSSYEPRKKKRQKEGKKAAELVDFRHRRGGAAFQRWTTCAFRRGPIKGSYLGFVFIVCRVFFLYCTKCSVCLLFVFNLTQIYSMHHNHFCIYSTCMQFLSVWEGRGKYRTLLGKSNMCPLANVTFDVDIWPPYCNKYQRLLCILFEVYFKRFFQQNTWMRDHCL